MSSIFERITSGIAQSELAKAKKRLPGNVQRNLPLARRLLFKGPGSAIDLGIDLLMQKYGVLGGPGTMMPPSSDEALRQPTPLLGGITLKQAREMYEECASVNWQKKNLWFITITNVQGGLPLNINLFATDVNYTGFSAIGEATALGSGQFDQVTGEERREIRLTTMDDDYGSVKRWFMERSRKMVKENGTVGLPVEYLFRVSIIHARVTEYLAAGDDPYIDSFIVRPGAIEIDLSRREDAMGELAMTFIQHDTFTGLS